MVDDEKKRKFVKPIDKNFIKVQEFDAGLLYDKGIREMLSEIF